MTLDDLKGMGIDEEKASLIISGFSTSTERYESEQSKLAAELEETRAKQAAAEAEREEARKAAADAIEEKLKATGTAEEIKAHFEAQLAEKTAAAEAESKAAREALISRDKGMAKAEILAGVDQGFRDFAGVMLDSMLTVEHGKDGAPSYKFAQGGKVVATDIQSFIAYAKEEPSWQRVMSAAPSTGGGATGGMAASTGKGYSKMTREEKIAFLETKQG